MTKQMTLVFTEISNTGSKEVLSESGLGHLEFEVGHLGEECTTSLEIHVFRTGSGRSSTNTFGGQLLIGGTRSQE